MPTRSSRLLKYFLIVLVGFYITYMLWLYPAILDFYYLNLVPYSDIIANHRVDILATGVGGAQILVLTLIEITGLSHFGVISTPLLLLPIYFLLVSVFRSLIDGVYSILLTVSFLLPFASPGLFVLGCHEVGLSLYLTLILILILNHKRNLNKSATAIVTVLIVVCINYMSYKIDALTILFLSILSIFLIIKQIEGRKRINTPQDSLHEHRPSKTIALLGQDRKEGTPSQKRVFGTFTLLSSHTYLPLVGLVIALGLNTFFYSTFAPYLEESTFDNIGLFKIFSTNSGNLVLSSLYSIPNYLQYIGTLRFFIIVAVLSMTTMILMRKYIHERDLSYTELIFLSSAIASGLILLIYTILGLFDYFYVLLSGYLGICLLNKYLKTSFSWSKAIIYILLISGLLYMALLIGSGYHMGHKASDEFQYLTTSTEWLGNHIEDDVDQHIKSDALTIGYISYQSSKQKILGNYPKTYFSVDDITQLLQPDCQKGFTYNTFFVLNSDLHYFAIERWYHLKSLSNYESTIRNNHNFNMLYSTGFVDIALK